MSDGICRFKGNFTDGSAGSWQEGGLFSLSFFGGAFSFLVSTGQDSKAFKRAFKTAWRQGGAFSLFAFAKWRLT